MVRYSIEIGQKEQDILKEIVLASDKNVKKRKFATGLSSVMAVIMFAFNSLLYSRIRLYAYALETPRIAHTSSTSIYIFSCTILISLFPPSNTAQRVPDHRSCPLHNGLAPVRESHNSSCLPDQHSFSPPPGKQKKLITQRVLQCLPLINTFFSYA